MRRNNRPWWLLIALLPFLLVRVVSLLWRLPAGGRIEFRQPNQINATVYTVGDPSAVSIEGAPATFVRTSPETIEVRATAVTFERRFTNFLGRPTGDGERFANVLLSFPGASSHLRTVRVA